MTISRKALRDAVDGMARAEFGGGRRSGRTLAMVKALPEDQAVTVIVPTRAMWSYLRRMVWDVRGPEAARLVHVVVAAGPEEIYRMAAMQPRDRALAFDHSCWDHLPPRAETWVLEQLRGRPGLISQPT